MKAAARALSGAYRHVEEVRLPVLEQTDGNSILWKLQRMETRSEFAKVTAATRTRSFATPN